MQTGTSRRNWDAAWDAAMRIDFAAINRAAMAARTITQALGGRWHGTYGTARCPAHEDRNPSLKLRDDPDKRDGINLH